MDNALWRDPFGKPNQRHFEDIGQEFPLPPPSSVELLDHEVKPFSDPLCCVSFGAPSTLHGGFENQKTTILLDSELRRNEVKWKTQK